MFRNAKYRAIVEDPVIRYKPVESLPGIGPVPGRRLRDNGFYTADQVLAQYLALKRNEQRFVSWMSMASGVSAHWAALCFNGLNEWYNTWGRDVKVPKKALTPDPERGSPITNRMLLEQKMLQFNTNAHEDRLRSLFSNQTISLVDISKSAERPKLSLQRLNKSNFNIAENTPFYTEKNRAPNSKKPPSPQTPKSVNFKENVEFNAQLPKKTPISAASKRPISPILKSRSLTPEFTLYSRKPLNLQSKVKSKGASMNNLNLTGSTNKREATKAKSIENISGSNTFTRSKSKTNAVKKLNLEKPEKLICTCNYPYREYEVWTSSEADGLIASQNIEEYFVEKHIDVKNENFATKAHSTPLKSKQSQKETQSSNTKLSNNHQRCNGKASKTQKERKISEDSLDEEHVALAEDNSNVDNYSDVSSDYVLTGNEDLHECNQSVTVDSRDLEDVKTENNKNENEHNLIDLIEEEHIFETEIETVAVESNHKTAVTNQTSFEKNYFDNSNEDSGLDVTPKSNADYKEFSVETQTTDDEGSTTPFENVDSRSESDTDTDRTFEVNDTTDAESGFHFVGNSANSSTQLDRVEENKAVESREMLLLENQIDHLNPSQLDDELKRSNIRLFCDMLSNDMEQLPMEKFRKLKLKILEMVYAEIDSSEGEESNKNSIEN